MGDISIDQRHRLTEILYDELIHAILKIIDKLDLSSNTSTQISSLVRFYFVIQYIYTDIIFDKILFCRPVHLHRYHL